MKNIRVLIAWVATFGLAVALIYEKSKPEKTREVPKEVVRKVEVIREVPKEVIREVEVVREVERALTDREKILMEVGRDFLEAEIQTTSEGKLKGIQSVSIQVLGSEESYELLPKQRMMDILELALRGNGIKIDPISPFSVSCVIGFLWVDRNIQAVYSVHTSVDGFVSFHAPVGGTRRVYASVDRVGYVGYSGSMRIADALAGQVKEQGETIALRLLRASDRR